MTMYDSTSSSNIIVSVCMITYNHEANIAQAIEGVLMQKTDFPIELVIGEDCSTDETRKIVQGYAERYSDKIRPLLSEYNLGMIPNFVVTLNACRGKYVALCEGDDYWTDPLKLQKQVDFLEMHPDHAICFHPAKKLYEATREFITIQNLDKKTAYDLGDIISGRIVITTVSVMLRRIAIQNIPSWYLSSPVGDTPLFVLASKHGKIGFLDQVMSVYRVHKRGIWQGADEATRIQMGIAALDLLRVNLGLEYEKFFKEPLSKLFLKNAWISTNNGDYISAKKYLRKSIHFSITGRWVDQVVLFARICFPRIYTILKTIQVKYWIKKSLS